MEKLLAMYVASQLTQAACGGAGQRFGPSTDLSDPNVRAMNLQVWETFRAFYAAVVQALGDNQDWPTPQIPVGDLAQSILQSIGPALPGLVASLGPMVTGSGPLAPLANQLMGLIAKPAAPAPRPALPQNLPNPGAKPAGK